MPPCLERQVAVQELLDRSCTGVKRRHHVIFPGHCERSVRTDVGREDARRVHLAGGEYIPSYTRLVEDTSPSGEGPRCELEHDVHVTATHAVYNNVWAMNKSWNVRQSNIASWWAFGRS